MALAKIMVRKGEAMFKIYVIVAVVFMVGGVLLATSKREIDSSPDNTGLEASSSTRTLYPAALRGLTHTPEVHDAPSIFQASDHDQIPQTKTSPKPCVRFFE